MSCQLCGQRATKQVPFLDLPPLVMHSADDPMFLCPACDRYHYAGECILEHIKFVCESCAQEIERTK